MATQTNSAKDRAELMLHAEQVKGDRMLSRLLLCLVPVAIGLAALHGMWLAGAGVGAALAAVPWLVASSRPGSLASRLTIAGAFMGYAALFIDEAHGMTELHF